MTQFKAGGMTGYSWGAVVAAAALVSLLLTALNGKKRGLKQGTVPLFGLLAIPLCILLGRAGYYLCSINRMQAMGVPFFDLAGGGMMLYGAAAGGLLAAFLTGKITKTPVGRIADCVAAPAALTIAAGRFAEYLTGAGYGFSVTDWFDPWNSYNRSFIAWEEPDILCRFPFAVQDPFYGDWMFAINLLEGIAAIVFAVILFRMKTRKDGGAAVLLLMMYASCQVVFESMREDEVLRLNFMKINMLISALVLLTALIICLKKGRADGRYSAGMTVTLFLTAGIATAMEFALEQKIGFLTWMRADLCYLVMGLACACMLLTVLKAWKKAFPVTEA